MSTDINRSVISCRALLEPMIAFPDSIADRTSFVRMDLNENTSVLSQLPLKQPGISKIDAYPHYGPLLSKLSDLYAVAPEQILLTAGSDDIFSAIASTFIEPDRDAAVIAAPTFYVIKHALLVARAVLKEVPLTADFQFDLNALEKMLLTGPRLVVLASPDNPSGAVLPAGIVERWTEQFPETLFVIDEAYYEFTQQTVIELVGKRANLMVVRTFSKAWGLAGLRVGTTIAPVHLINQLKKVRLPFPVSSLSVEVVRDALQYREQVQRCADETMMRKRKIVEELRDRAMQFVEGRANFVLLQLGNKSASFCDHMRERKILVKNLTPPPHAASSVLCGFVRVAVGAEADNQRFLEAMREFLN